MDFVEGAPEDCQGQCPDGEAGKGRNLLWVSYTLYIGLLLLLGCRSAIQEAAAEEEVKVATYCREAILARAMPEPELPDVATLPAWLLHFLLFLTRGKTKPVYPGSSLYVLTGTLASAGNNSTFTAPAGATLEAVTPYFVFFEDTNSSTPHHNYSGRTVPSGTTLDTESHLRYPGISRHFPSSGSPP